MEEFGILQLVFALLGVLVPLGVLIESHTRWAYWWERPTIWACGIVGLIGWMMALIRFVAGVSYG